MSAQFHLIDHVLLKSIDDYQVALSLDIDEVGPVEAMASDLQVFIAFPFYFNRMEVSVDEAMSGLFDDVFWIDLVAILRVHPFEWIV